VKVDKKKIRFPKMKFKGSFHPTVIRREGDKEGSAGEKKPAQKTRDVKANGDPPAASVTAPAPSPAIESGAREPEYAVKYRHTANMEDTAVYQVR
jgi:hypothetical protein